MQHSNVFAKMTALLPELELMELDGSDDLFAELAGLEVPSIQPPPEFYALSSAPIKFEMNPGLCYVSGDQPSTTLDCFDEYFTCSQFPEPLKADPMGYPESPVASYASTAYHHHGQDNELKEIMHELLTPEVTAGTQQTLPPTVPLCEPSQQPQQPQRQQHQQSQHRRRQQQQPRHKMQIKLKKRRRNDSMQSSWELDDTTEFEPTSVERDFSGFGDSQHSVATHREAQIQEMAAYIKEVIDRGSSCPVSNCQDASSKLKVHEVILTILLNSEYGNRGKDLRRILAFCDEHGHEISGGSVNCRHFKTLDTETMGLLWQCIKGNKKASYDTFARAMRVRREKSEGYFEYLDSGKRSKKRVYRLGDKALADMDRVKQTLRQFSEPLQCGF